MGFDISGTHPFSVHGKDLFFDILTDAGLILFQKLGFKFSFAIPGDSDFHITKAGTKGFAAVAVAAVIRFLIFVIVLAIAELLIQFGIQMLMVVVIEIVTDLFGKL